MKKTKAQYIELLEKIFFKYNLSGSLLKRTYTDGIRTEDLTCCYVDGRIRKSKLLRKELVTVVNQFLNDYPEATKPLYS